MKKTLITSFWSGIIVLFVYLIYSPILIFLPYSELKWSFTFIGLMIGGISSILFLNGFRILGKKYKSNLLVVMSYIGIIFFILYLIFGLIMGFTSLVKNVSAQENFTTKIVISSLDVENLEEFLTIGLKKFTIIIVIIYILIMLIFGLWSLLFGIGLLKLKDKLEYAKTAGVLNIIAGLTYFIMIGFAVAIAAHIFELVILYNASKKFEKQYIN